MRQLLSVQRILGFAGICVILTIVLTRSDLGERLRGQAVTAPPPTAGPPPTCYECRMDITGCQAVSPCPRMPDDIVYFQSTDSCRAKCKVYCGPANACLFSTTGDTTHGIYNTIEECEKDPRCPRPQGGGGGTGGGAVAPPPSDCGNGTVEGTEECDDGNQVNEDGCANDCKNECGNGAPNGNEECDDGNDDDSDGCLATCKKCTVSGNLCLWPDVPSCCPYKKHEFAFRGYIQDKIPGPINTLFGFFKVNDVNTASFAKDKFLHFGIPALLLMPKMHTCF